MAALRLFYDVETIGNNPWDGELLMVAYAVDDEPVRVAENGEWEDVRRFLENPDVTKVEFTKYDARWFRLWGRVTSRGLGDPVVNLRGPIEDVQVMAHMVNENTPLDLEWVAKKYADVTMDKRLRRVNGKLMFETDDELLLDLVMYHDWLPVYQEQMREYNIRDVEAMRATYYALRRLIGDMELEELWQREQVPYTSVLLGMEARGLPVDLDETAVLATEVAELRDAAKQELLADGGLPESFNLNSQHHLNAYLFSRAFELKDRLVYDKDTLDCLKACAAGDHEEDCGDAGYDESIPHVLELLPEGFVVTKLGNTTVEGYWPLKGRGLEKTPKPVNKVTGEEGKLPSTSSPELLYAHANDEWVRKLCTGYRKYEKLMTTYLEKYPTQAHGGRIYGGFKQTGTVTGRLSSSNPNLQNQPARGALGKKMRSLFVAPEGRLFVIGDYDQLEMRLMAHLSEDPRLVQVFRDGKDPHVETMLGIWGDVDPTVIADGAALTYRDAAKQLNYAMGYQAGAKKVAQTLSLFGFPTTPEMAKGYLTEMRAHYRGYFKWTEHVIERAKRRGFVTTIGGRRRRLRAQFKDVANWKLMRYGERQAVNAIVQGSAADILRRAQLAAVTFEPILVQLAQIHDEVIFEGLRGELFGMLLQDVQDVFEDVGYNLRVPLRFEPVAVETWAEKSGSGIDLLLEEDE